MFEITDCSIEIFLRVEISDELNLVEELLFLLLMGQKVRDYLSDRNSIKKMLDFGDFFTLGELCGKVFMDPLNYRKLFLVL